MEWSRPARLQRKALTPAFPYLCRQLSRRRRRQDPDRARLAKLLRDLGETPVVLSRGYGGRLRGPLLVDPARHDAADVGDEPLMLARRAGGVARDRIDGLSRWQNRKAPA